jgi:CYTH domain-containing protein
MRKERDLRSRFLDVVREMEKELDELVETGVRTDLMPESDAIEYLVLVNDRLVAKQRHLLELVGLLVELADFDDVDASPHLRLVAADHD